AGRRGLFIFFFFQVEGGIRDATVTGVQTCALPISASTTKNAVVRRSCFSCALLPITFISFPRYAPYSSPTRPRHSRAIRVGALRSEERRVGKECRAGWRADEHRDKATQIKRQCKHR